MTLYDAVNELHEAQKKAIPHPLGGKIAALRGKPRDVTVYRIACEIIRGAWIKYGVDKTHLFVRFDI